MNIQHCTWPDLPMPYAQALQDAVAFIAARFEPIAILACGTILRGTPDPSSDLDIYVIHRQPFRQRIQKFFNGVPAEIFVNPPQAVERYLSEEQAERRPLTAHMLATGFVIYQADAVIERLRAQASQRLAEAPPADPDQTLFARYMAATLYEDALDVVARDPDTAHMLLGQSVTAMLHFAFRERGLFIPRSKDLLNATGALSAGLETAARRFFTAGTLAEKLTWVERIADLTIQTRGFFEWESKPDEMAGDG